MIYVLGSGFAQAQPVRPPLQPIDVFAMEYALDPQISPDGRTIAYVRRSFDIMTDRARSNIWLVDVKSGRQRPLLSGTASYTSPRWSPDGGRLAYVTGADRDPQIYVRWMDNGATARVTDLTSAPDDISWSPDGTRIAFTMFEPEKVKPLATMPEAPKGATWAAAPKVIDRLNYRADGQGYLEQGNSQIFVVGADGGAPRRVTSGAFDAGQPEWSADGKALIFSANRNPDREMEPNNSDIYSVDIATGAVRPLTTRKGPDQVPDVSPDGRMIAFTGFDDRYQGNQRDALYVMAADGTGVRELARGLDRDVQSPQWRGDGKGIYFLYDDKGVTRLALATLDGGYRDLAEGLGGQDLGRPYSGASFSVAARDGVAFNVTAPDHPADVGVLAGSGARRLTRLNDDLFGARTLAKVEPLTARSKDGTEVGAWVMYPPGFDRSRRYPMILEIHGGPFTNYGPRFTWEMQAFAAAGYVVVYANPRGSTSYGEKFANHIHHAYPGDDYDDLIAAVDAAIARGGIDDKRLFVTGGSGGGVLTAWIVGKTDRFRAAVVAKPVINWTSFVLTADSPAFFWRYWFGEQPWADGAQANYWRRSPLSLVGNVKTPTMLLTGETDYRTPISESEQYYTALKLRGVESALVRVPDVGHALVTRPSQLIAKTQYILAWFARFDVKAKASPATAEASAPASVAP